MWSPVMWSTMVMAVMVMSRTDDLEKLHSKKLQDSSLTLGGFSSADNETETVILTGDNICTKQETYEKLFVETIITQLNNVATGTQSPRRFVSRCRTKYAPTPGAGRSRLGAPGIKYR